MDRLSKPLRAHPLFNVLLAFSALTTLTLCSPCASAENKWVTVAGKASDLRCLDAKALAHDMYYSKAPYLYGPLAVPETMNSTLVLGASEKDISGGGPLSTVDEAYFVRQDRSQRGTYVNWGQTTEGDKRLALVETNQGWRGYTYSLFQVDARLTLNDWKEVESSAPAFFSDLWRPPLIFSRNDSHTLWFIDVEQSFGPLADWGVYGFSGTQYEKICDLRFTSEKTSPMSALPSSILQLEHLLDATMGPDANEGTMQSTARRRGEVFRVWVNVAKRPWALSESDVYNSTSEVEDGLRDWAARGPKALATYESIKKQYPKAERALAKYFQKTFQLNNEKAKALATWTLDIAMRAHFSFPNGAQYFRYDDVNTNPWWQ